MSKLPLRTALFILLVAFMSTIPTAVMAQSTTSSIAGTATDSEGVLPGAVITAIHTPSGTRYSTIANQKGAYRFEGLRTGGPYHVEATYVGHNKATAYFSRLQLGEVYECHLHLADGNELTEVVVKGKNTRKVKTGGSEHIMADEIEKTPAVERWIDDITRLSPYFMGNAFGGRDQGMNNYSIDGANFNFNMGLDRGRLPADNRPISIDALEEVQIVTSAFDVKNSNFMGASVNMVTKKGTNTFRGTAYTFFKNEYLRGNEVGGEFLGKREREQRNIYGITLGGPILKDKLFFFVNGEYEHSPYPIYKWNLSADGKADASKLISRVTDADMAAFAGVLKNKYGWDPGSWNDFSGNNDTYRLLARLDWNISDKHHAMLRYNFTGKTKDNPASSGGLVNTPVSAYSQTFRGSTWQRKDNVHSLTLEVNSMLPKQIHNTLRASFTFNDANNRESEAAFPTIEIQKEDEGGVSRPFMNAGYDQHAWNNGIKERVWNVEDYATMLVGNHFLTTGMAFERITSYNCYMRYGAGYYRYKTFDDFVNGAQPIAFAMTYSLTGEKKAKAEVGYNRFSFYTQDEWRVNNRLRLLLGLRFDLPNYTNHRYENPAVKELADKYGEHLNTGEWPKARLLFSPRVGFNYDLTEDGSLRLRGGSGIFTGRFPLVYLSKMQEGSGMLQTTVQDTGNNGILAHLTGGVRTPEQVLAMVAASGDDALKSKFPTQPGAKNNLVTIDRNFKMPQVWKSTLAADYKLPLPFDAELTLEGTFAKDINAITAYDANINKEKVEAKRFGGNDNRFFYPGAADKRIEKNNGYAYVVTNTSKGYSANLMAQLKMTPVKDLNLMAAYTYTVSKTLNSAPSNQVEGWDCKNQASVNGFNYLETSNARYIASPHRVIASASYRFTDTRDRISTFVSLFYEGRRMGSYTYVYLDDMNNDGVKGNDLLYVPATKDELLFKEFTAAGHTYTVDEQRDAFWAFVNQDDYLKDRKGKYAEPFAAFNPWCHRFDLRLMWEFKMMTGKQKNRLQLSFDILNVGNLLNNNWGVQKMAKDGTATQPLKRVGVNENNVPIYQMTTYTENGQTKLIDRTFDRYFNASNCWQMQVGVKYLFN